MQTAITDFSDVRKFGLRIRCMVFGANPVNSDSSSSVTLLSFINRVRASERVFTRTVTATYNRKDIFKANVIDGINSLRVF